METVGIGVFGAGWVSGEHVRAYQNNPRSQVVAIGSRTRSSAETRAAEAGLADIHICDTLEEMLADPAVSAVSLCTPPHQHPEQAVAIARAGKHILIEKAAANTLAGLRAMQAAVSEAGVRTVVSFVLRWNPEFEWIRKMTDDGAIGSIFYAEVDYWHNIGPQYKQYAWNIQRAIGGSVWLSAGCHAVDAIRWLVRDEVDEVTAYSNRRNADYEYDTNAVGIVRFAGGAIGKLSASFDVKSPYAFNIDLLGDRGTIRDNRIHAATFFPGQTDWIEVPTVRPDSGDVRHHPFQGEIDHFVECIVSGVESHVNLADAIRTHEVCIALERSAQQGGPVRVAELPPDA